MFDPELKLTFTEKKMAVITSLSAFEFNEIDEGRCFRLQCFGFNASGNVFKRLTYLLILQTADIVCFKLKNNVVTDLGARSGVLSPYVF